MFSLAIVPVFAAVASVRAANDWSIPCFDGKCEYSLPAAAGAASGSLKIWGSANAIADITAAGGWQIIGCSPDALAQNIRLVCEGDQCDNLYSGTGAEGKIVRLPENCGKSAFARVAKAYTPEDQSIPEAVAKRLVKRAGKIPGVRALTLDTNFAAIDVAKVGKVNIAIQGANFPGISDTIATPSPSTKRRRAFTKRDIFDDAREALDNAIGAIQDVNEVNINETQSLPPIDIDQPFNLFDKSIACGPVSLGVSVDVDAKAHAEVAVGVVAVGTIVPPSLDQFELVTNMNADLNGEIDFKATANGQLDSGKITLFEVGIPGLNFPGILSIGPSFQINAQAIASLDVAVDLKVGVNYKISDAKLVFPPDGKQADGGFDIADTPLKLSATPSAQANGTLEAHLIPTLNLGISALGDVVEANVFLELDGKAVLKLSLEAEGSEVELNRRANVKDLEARSLFKRGQREEEPKRVAVTHTRTRTAGRNRPHRQPQHGRPRRTRTRHAARPSSTQGHIASSSAGREGSSTSAYAEASSTVRGSASESATSTSDSARPSSTGQVGAVNPPNENDNDNDANFGGCFEILAGFAINVGADASFFGLFDQETKATLFEREFELFKKCFGSKAGTENQRRRGLAALLRRHTSTSTPSLSLTRRQAANDALVCAPGDQAASQTLIDQLLNAAGIKALP